MWRLDAIVSAAVGFAVGVTIVAVIVVREFDHS